MKGFELLSRHFGLCPKVVVINPTNRTNFSGDGAFQLYQKNLNFRMADRRPVVADIQSSDAHAVTLQEVPERLLPILNDLAESYPHKATCSFHPRVGGVAVLTQAEIEEIVCLEGQGVLAARITAPDGLPLWIVSIHLHWPYPYRQAEQLHTVLPALEALQGRVVIGGDFNMVPWGYATRRIRRATNTARTWSPLSTFPRFQPLAPMPIDLVFAPGGGAVQKRGL